MKENQNGKHTNPELRLWYRFLVKKANVICILLRNSESYRQESQIFYYVVLN